MSGEEASEAPVQDPWAEPASDGRLSVTLKQDKGHEATWVNIAANTANGLKDRLIEFFGMGDEARELKPYEVAVNATQLWHATGNITREFPGARAVPATRNRGRGRANDPEQPTEDTPAEPAEPVDPKAKLLEEIEACTTVDQLKDIWARESTQGRPLTDDVLAAWKAKGKSLKGGSN